MIVKKTNQLGNFRRGINLYVPKRTIATTTSVGSLLFNDPNQFLQFSRSETISILDPEPFTIEAWIKPTSIKTIANAGLDANGNPNGDYGDIIIGDTEGGGNNWSLQLFNNKLTFYCYNGGARFFTSNTQIPLNEWTHVAVAYDGGSTLWIFVNGTLDATFGDYSRPSIQYSVITIGNLFDAGSTVWANGAYAYKGYITNLRINDNQTFYQMFSSFEPAAPLEHIYGTTLLLLANTNQPIKDSSPSNITITNVGSVASTSEYPTVADCSNNDAKVLMVGWPGPRPLTRDNQNHYTYYAGASPGDETLDRADSSSPWVYKNVGNEIARSLTVSQFPWQASWPSTHTATKICPQAPDIDNMFFPSLWLDASTGVNKFDYNYISQIVLSGDASITGTYNASSIPTYNFEDERLNDYSLGNINYGIYDYELKFKIQTDNGYVGGIGYESSNGINWSPYNGYTVQFTITGFTGIYTGANGTYYNTLNVNDPIYNNENGQFILYNDQLTYVVNEPSQVIATKNNDGSFTPTSYDSSLTLSNAGTTSVNGIYTRSDSQIDIQYLPFLASEGRRVYFESSYWFVYGELYIAYGSFDWGLGDGGGASPVPTNSFGTSPRSIGSPRISSSVSNPNGSITGTITTSNAISDNVTSWDDQSNNGNNATAYNGPELITNELNGKSVISFNGSSSYLEAGISLSQNQNRTIFIVGKYNDINAGQQGFLNLLGDGAESYVFKQAELDESYYYIGGAQIAAPTSVSVGNYHIVSISNNTEPNTSTMTINGVAGNNYYGEMTTRYASYVNIGSRDANQEFLNGSIAEIIIYNRGLTTSERQEVENYLSNKYAILMGLNNGLLAYWKLDTTGWIDSSENGRNLTLVGSLSNPAGLLGNSASGFSGNDYLITPSGLAPLSGKRTYSCWVYFNSNDIGYQIIWGQGGTDDYQSTYPFIIETDNQITSWFTTENGHWTNGIDSGIIPDTDVWYHLVLTFDGSIGILYVNGTSVGSSEYSGSILAPDIDRFLLGRYYIDIDYNDNEFNPLTLDGKIDEVGVWDRALSQQEITSLYNAGAGKAYPFN
jgi:hypothetical protein